MNFDFFTKMTKVKVDLDWFEHENGTEMGLVQVQYQIHMLTVWTKHPLIDWK